MECSHGREPWNSIEEVCRRRGESHRPLRSDGVPRYVDGTSELRASLDLSPAKVPVRRGRARRGVAASKADVDDAVHTLGGKKCDDDRDVDAYLATWPLGTALEGKDFICVVPRPWYTSSGQFGVRYW